ncbi:inhibitor of apoptosis protein isoform X1 [Salmo salar]|uniref:Inhibitor of apoptosis protein isoform X1 n=1 Tax=Salmo salar TaxID=8030 RepID=A0A1S3Q735_SALSA|nr:inhibitor of apoptosis protein-like isoform X1 [Salmo salar]|eukprot:XP_014035707.1 PREDICTED: inhibitor of apoptosis protein-like isoform X2 [Salmo salar]
MPAHLDYVAMRESELLNGERGNIVKGLNEANIKLLVDILFNQKVINQFEKEAIMETHGRADKARALVDMTYAKGERVSELMITLLKDVDPVLFNGIFLKADSMDGSPVFNMR